jgi:hypothetical protein
MVPVHDGRLQPQQDDWYGGIYFRKVGPFPAGYVFGGHDHEIDHVTSVNVGSVSLATRVNGEWVEQARYIAPIIFNVPAKVEHRITALEDGTSWACLFAITEDGRRINY